MTEKNKSGKNKEREKYPKGYMNDGEKDLTGMSQKNILLRTEQNRTEQNRTEQNRTEQSRTERLSWHDVLKGIGIILVVIGHVYSN